MKSRNLFQMYVSRMCKNEHYSSLNFIFGITILAENKENTLKETIPCKVYKKKVKISNKTNTISKLKNRLKSCRMNTDVLYKILHIK